MRIVQEALTFDDVLLLPAHSAVLPKEVQLKTKISRNIDLNIPLVSAAMDTVTEARLAISMAQEGGLGIIHKNMTPEKQAYQVRAVKKFESGVIKEPITVTPDTSIQEVLELTHARNISGVPVVQGEELVGIVTGRDLRFETRYSSPVSNIMTPKEKLVTVKEGAEKEEILKLLHEHRIEKLLVVDDKFQLRGLVTVKDIQKAKEFPNACKDDQGRLRVGAAVGVGEGTEARVEALIAAGDVYDHDMLLVGAYWDGAAEVKVYRDVIRDFVDPDELGNALRLIGGDKLTLVATGETAAIAGGAVTVDLTVWGLRGKRLVE